MPPFQPKATVPVPAPTTPSATGPPPGAAEGFEDVALFDVPSANVVEVPVVRLPDHGIDGSDLLVPRKSEEMGDDGVRGLPNGEGVGRYNGISIGPMEPLGELDSSHAAHQHMRVVCAHEGSNEDI